MPPFSLLEELLRKRRLCESSSLKFFCIGLVVGFSIVFRSAVLEGRGVGFYRKNEI